jgi:L-threonylcarbamoyladenylate synthase
LPVLSPDLMDQAVAQLRAGGLVAFPTETVYGLGADALNPVAVGRVFALKGRPATNPLIVHVADEAMARSLAGDWPDEARRLAAAFWPGPLTIVVPRAPVVSGLVTAGGGTVALRVPDHPIALELLRAFGGPLVGPSANPSGRVSPTTAAHVREAFSEEDVMVLDGGPCRAGIESTVVQLAPEPRILRLGVVTPKQIKHVLGHPVAFDALPIGDSPAPSPGLHPRHYSPVTPAVLFTPEQLPALLGSDKRIVFITHHVYNISPPGYHHIRLPGSSAEYAAWIYSVLRYADELAPDLIAIEQPPAEGGLWLAITDRLTRATSR